MSIISSTDERGSPPCSPEPGDDDGDSDGDGICFQTLEVLPLFLDW